MLTSVITQQFGTALQNDYNSDYDALLEKRVKCTNVLVHLIYTFYQPSTFGDCHSVAASILRFTFFPLFFFSLFFFSFFFCWKLTRFFMRFELFNFCKFYFSFPRINKDSIHSFIYSFTDSKIHSFITESGEILTYFFFLFETL